MACLKSIKKFCILIILFCTLCVLSYGQTEVLEQETLTIVPPDSVGEETKRGVLESFKTIFSGEPGKAALYGLLIPSGGQIYNKKYWKVPLVLAADGVAIGFFLYYRKEYYGFRDAHANVINGVEDSYRNIYDEASLRQNRNNFRLNMERGGIAIGVVHLISIIEAFTDRHLFTFDVDENLSFDVKYVPSTQNVVPSYGFTYTF